MNRYLLFDAGCSLCSGLAADIATASDGLLAARSLNDPEMQAAVKRARPAWSWEPTLLEVQGDDAHVFTGFALRTQLLTVLGPRRAWRVAQLVAHAQTPLGDIADESRRAVVKRGASLAAGVVGLALLGPTTSHAQEAFVAAANMRRPGRHSRNAGVRSWKVRRHGSNFAVTFEHKVRRLSGSARVSVGGNGTARTMLRTRGSERWQIAFSPGGFAAKDNRGQSATGRLTGEGRSYRWAISSQSRRVFGDSAEHFLLVMAIAADLERQRPLRARAAEVKGVEVQSGEAIVSSQEVPAAPPDCADVFRTCSRYDIVGGGEEGASLSASKLNGLYALDDECRAQTGQVCCCLVGCLCPCLSDFFEALVPGFDYPFNDDLGCSCNCTGKPYFPNVVPAAP